MTDEQARALGERWLAACGISSELLLAVDSLRSRGLTMYRGTVSGVLWRLDEASATWWPDLRDPATRGAALEVVRERWSDPAMYLMPLWRDLACTRRVWVVARDADAEGRGSGDTEAEALVAALEAAP